MKKRILSVFAAFLLVAGLWVIQASAAGTSVYVSAPSYSFTAADGSAVANSTDAGKVKLIVFHNSCPNSISSVSAIADADWVNNPNLSVISAQYNVSTVADLASFAQLTGNSSHITYCHTGGVSTPMWNFLYACGNSGSVTLPVSMVVDANGYIRHFLTGNTGEAIYRTVLADYVPGIDAPGVLDVAVMGTYNYNESYAVLSILNQTRKELGLSELTLDAGLQDAAMQRAAECSLYYSHTRPNGESCFTAMSGLDYYGAAENIAIGSTNAAAVMDGWINSPGHYANLTNPNMNAVGLGCFESDGIKSWVQLFGGGMDPVVPDVYSNVAGTANVEALDSNVVLDAYYSNAGMKTGQSGYPAVYAVNQGWTYACAELDPSCLSIVSDNPSVVAVTGPGIVSALKAGTANLTIKVIGGTDSVSMKVTVTGDPVAALITRQPTDKTVDAGQYATFTVDAEGVGLKYQWQYSTNGTSWNNTTLAGYNTSALKVMGTAANNGRQYRCKLTNGSGAVSYTDAAELTVNSYLKITAQPKHQVASGGTVSFKVSASGTGLKYQWQYSLNGKDWSNTTLNGCNSTTLNVGVNNTTNNRRYRCKITDAYGFTVTSNAAVLYKRADLKITAQPTDQKGSSGYVYFTVGASGDGLKYQWQYSLNGTAWSKTTLTGYNTNELRVAANAANNGRSYRCVVTDTYGRTVTSAGAKFVKTTALKITAQPEDQIAPKGYVYFAVDASGTGLKYQWQWKGTASTSTWANTTLTGWDTDELQVMASAANDGRQYRCVITDAYGQKVTSNAAKLYKRTPLSITADPKAQNVKDGAKAVFTVDASGDGLSYQWQWKASGGWSDTKLSGYNTDTLTITASTATNGRQYRCVVTDKYGNEEISASAKLILLTPELTVDGAYFELVGGKAYFAVEVDYEGDYGDLEFQWQYSLNGTNWSDTTLTGYDTEELTVSNVSACAGRQYRCVVTDTYGSRVVSDAATLVKK